MHVDVMHTVAGTSGRKGGSPAPPLGRQPGRGSRHLRSYPTTAAGSPLSELILIRCTAACPRAALAAFSFSSDLQHTTMHEDTCKECPLLS